MKYDHQRALALMLAAIFILACVPAGAETLVVSADRMFDARAGKVTGPVRVVVRDGLIEDRKLVDLRGPEAAGHQSL